MSLVKKPEMTEENLAAHRANGAKSHGPVTPEGKANSAAANLRHGFYSEQDDEVMMRLGENPRDYHALMDSLAEDLQPRAGLESQLVLRMGRALWRMQRAERMREGLALKRIESEGQAEELTTATMASHAMHVLEPYERLQEALARPDGPTAAEIDAFVTAFGGNPSPGMPEFVRLLNSLKEPLREADRKLARRKARKQLKRLMESHESMAYRFVTRASRVYSPENLAALAAPQDDPSMLMQRMDDSNLRQLWRLTNVLFKVRSGGLTSKDVKNGDRSGDVYENKGEPDKMSSE